MTRPTRQQLLRGKALGYLAQREQSYQELKRKLEAYVSRLAAKEIALKAKDGWMSIDDEGSDDTHQADFAEDAQAHISMDGSELIESLLEDFKQRGWLSEKRFTEQLVHARKHKFGSMRIANELREKGIAEDFVEQAVKEVKQDEFANALAICRKKYHAPPASREEWAKQARFLQSRGFNFDVIKRVLNSTHEEDN